MLNLATYKDAQYGLLIPTPALMALLHLENRSYLQRLKSQLAEGIDYIKIPNPSNNNSPDDALVDSRAVHQRMEYPQS